MTKAYFLAIFGRSTVDERVETLLDNNTIYWGEPEKTTIIYENDFENDSSHNITTGEVINGHSLYLDRNMQFSKEYAFNFSKEKNKWIRASADFRTLDKEWTSWKMTQFVLKFFRGTTLIETRQIRVQRILSEGETKNIFLDVKIPSQSFNRVSVLFWNAGGDKKIIIDNLKIIAF
jgi:hypothetical protein